MKYLTLKRLPLVLLATLAALGALILAMAALLVLLARQHAIDLPEGDLLPDHLWLTHVRQLDLHTGELTPVHIEMRAGTIVKIQAALPDESDTPRLDGGGRVVMPGLIDSHIHLFDGQDLSAYVRYGITSVRNMMGLPVHLRWRAELEAAHRAPRLITASPTLNAGNEGGPLHKYLHSADAIAPVVARYAAAGYDLIKFYDGLSEAQFTALAAAATEYRLPIAGHPPRGLPLAQLLAVKSDSLEHLEEVFQGLLDYNLSLDEAEPALQQLAQSQIPVVTTLVAYQHVAAAGLDPEGFDAPGRANALNGLIGWLGMQMLSPAEHPDERQWLADKQTFLSQLAKRLDQLGARLVAGSDTGPALTAPGLALHEELALLEQAGLDTLTILRMVTERAAPLLHRSEVTGHLRPGSAADLLLLDQNPAQSLAALQTPAAVISQGRQYVPARMTAVDHSPWYITLGHLLDHLWQL